jgi:phage baseplate assembly protein V
MKAVSAIVDPLKRRVMLMVGKCVVKAVKDASKVQSMQIEILSDEIRDDAERYQNYGFTSVPHVGAQGIAVFPGGNRDQPVIIAIEDRRYRLKNLANGEVAMYTDEGDSIIFRRGNKLEIKTSSLQIETPKLSIKNAGGQDIIATLSDLVNALINAKTATMTGPQPLVGAEFPTIKSVIDSFKVV